MQNQREVAVLITAYNEGEVIGDVIKKIPPAYMVYVVDDGSTDNTVDVAERHGAEVVSLPVNVGQGAAAIVGYKAIAMEKHTYLVKMDGDGQHNPAEIHGFVDKIRQTGVDTVVGSRILGSNYRGAPLARRVFLKPLTWIINKLTGYTLTDSMCGFRAFSRASLKKIIPIFEQIKEPEYMAAEMWIRFAKAGISVTEVPIALSQRQYGFSYKGLFRYGWGVCATIVRTTLDMFKYKNNNN